MASSKKNYVGRHSAKPHAGLPAQPQSATPAVISHYLEGQLPEGQIDAVPDIAPDNPLGVPKGPKSGKHSKGAHSASRVGAHSVSDSGARAGKHGMHSGKGSHAKRTPKAFIVLTLIKYLFSAVLIILAASTMREPWFAGIGLIELVAVFFLTNALLGWHKVLANVINDILMFIINAQFVVLYYGGTFVSLVMLNNIGSAKDLAGNGVIYIVAIVAVIVCTFLPVLWRVKMPRPASILGVLLSLALAIGLSYWTAGKYDPYVGLYNLVNGMFTKAATANKYTDTQTDMFYNEDVPGNRDKPIELPEHPNVIVIFTEGLSQSVVDDDYDIMPNVRYWQGQSLNFTNYYNHTFATYRGLNGQLYSGYQGGDYDANDLISMQSILHDNGYTTRFINTEPGNPDFTIYLEHMQFDDLMNPDYLVGGSKFWLSDAEAYDILFSTAEELNAQGQPFFISIYTFNTHVSWDRAELLYGDGENAVLNKFYDCDYQFGRFMERFNESDLADNTIIIFTSDHATYRDKDFSDTFPETADARENAMVDTMPLFIYYKGITPETVDAAGRNSLDMAPTVLDYLDLTGPNYFLGHSLFFPAEEAPLIEHVFNMETDYFITETGTIRELTDDEMNLIEEIIQRYLRICNPAVQAASASTGWRPNELHDDEHNVAAGSNIEDELAIPEFTVEEDAPDDEESVEDDSDDEEYWDEDW